MLCAPSFILKVCLLLCLICLHQLSSPHPPLPITVMCCTCPSLPPALPCVFKSVPSVLVCLLLLRVKMAVFSDVNLRFPLCPVFFCCCCNCSPLKKGRGGCYPMLFGSCPCFLCFVPLFAPASFISVMSLAKQHPSCLFFFFFSYESTKDYLSILLVL